MRCFFAVAIAAGFAGPAIATETTFQKIGAAGCETIYTDEISATSLCTGPDGTPFLLTDGDARISVTFGGVDRRSHPAFQSFANFNSVGDTIEWRVDEGVPMSTVLRWHIQGGDGETGADGQVLVVSKVGSANSPGCVVAYVDAMANRGANILARDAADMIAPNVDCATHVPFYYGRRGPTAGEPVLGQR